MTHPSLLSCFANPLPAPEAAVLDAVDLAYAIRVAARVADFGEYERGFRPAGSEAARRCAAYLAEEMRRIGLPEVTVAEFPLDGWVFAGARVEPEGGDPVEAAAYGGASGTPPEGLAGDLVDCGGGLRSDYERVDVTGKIALVEMDLEALNWPGVALLEAAQHGAIGVVCWPAHGYAETPGALHSHDLQVHSPIPMLNVSREDGRRLRSCRRARIVSSARNVPGAAGRNIVGLIPGTESPAELVIIGDHYDAWFHGFMDDGVGVGAVLALARAVVASGHRPRRTLAFVLHDAEEYGQADSPWDWCTGAWAQVTRVRPDWAERAVGAVIFELCGFKEAPTLDWYTTPELASLAESVLEQLTVKGRYPLGRRLYRQVSSWEDSFSYTVMGIPSIANLELPEAVRSRYYHTQFDTAEQLDPAKYALHVAGLGLLALRLADAALPPYDFAVWARALRETLPAEAPERLLALLERLESLGVRLNRWRPEMAAESAHEVRRLMRLAAGVLNHRLTCLGGEGMDETRYPHEQPYRDLQALTAGDLTAVTGMSWGRYVSYPVYRRQLFRHKAEPGAWQQWAEGRVSEYVDVWQAFHDGSGASPSHLAQARAALLAAYEQETQAIEEAVELLEQALA